jgi:hypothetical protein
LGTLPVFGYVGFFFVTGDAGRRAWTGTKDSWTMTPELSDFHGRVHDCTFRHPTARNQRWGDVRSMFSPATEAGKPNENLEVTRSGPKSALHVSPEENLY